MMTTAEIHSRTSSRQSQLETSRSDTMSTDNFFIDSYHSQDSANTYRSADINYSKTSYDSSMNSQDNLMISRRASHTLQTEPIFIGRNELEQMRVPRSGQNVYEFESHSLPRRTCIHHTPEEYHTHSLPRREHHHHYLHEHNEVKLSNGSIPEQLMTTDGGRRRLSATYQDAQHSYVNVNVVPDTYSLSRRSSAHLQHQQVPSISMNLQQIHQHHHQQQQQVVPPSEEELCSTCSSESSTETDESGSETEEEENDEEKEIFIDFKPRISPTPSPSASMSKRRRKQLMKAMSEGEILHEDAGKGKQLPIHAASEEDLVKPPADYSRKNLEYADTPIRDEDIFKADKYLNVSPDASTTAIRYTREAFRKRSVSLEDPLADVEIVKKSSRSLKANGSSPGSPKSSFASSDDITRDHSDGNWNESQATVLPRPPR